jgi:hypothetical protein
LMKAPAKRQLLGQNEMKLIKARTISLSGPGPAIDAEFKASRSIESVFSRACLSPGRCFGSKSGYRRSFPDHQFVPNANVFCRTRGKVWWGDLDLARDKGILRTIAKRLRVRLYVLSEFDGRFENAELPHLEVKSRAIWHTGAKQ